MTVYQAVLDYPAPWLWMIAALLLFALEAVVPGVFLLWIGLAAAIAGLATFYAGLSIPYQLVAFGVAALVSVLFARLFLRYGVQVSNRSDLNARGHQYVGRVFVVEEAIVNGRGKIKVGDSLWTAEGADAAAGTRVRVKGTNGTVLLVDAA